MMVLFVGGPEDRRYIPCPDTLERIHTRTKSGEEFVYDIHRIVDESDASLHHIAVTRGEGPIAQLIAAYAKPE